MKRKSLLALLVLPLLTLASCGDTTSTPAPNPSTTVPSPSTSEPPSSSSTGPVIPEVSSIQAIRELAVGEVIQFTGVTVKHIYTGQTTPYITGVLMANETGTIYVYGEDFAKSVTIGRKLTITGTKAYYVPNTDTGAAEATGYKGQLQLKDPIQVKDHGDFAGLPAGSVNEINSLETVVKAPLNVDISNTLYKISGHITKQVGGDYVNYYLTDLDRITTMRFYTQSNGKDFAWLEPYVGKTVSMIFSAVNAKPGEQMWRGVPIEVIEEVTVIDEVEAKYAAVRGLSGLLDEYKAAGDIILPSSDTALENVSYRYQVSQSTQASIVEVSGGSILRLTAIDKNETITVTASATYNGKIGTATKEIKLSPAEAFDTITIAEAKSLKKESKVVVEAVVMKVTKKAGNAKQGLFIADSTGTFFVYAGAAYLDNIKDVEEGNRIVVKGEIDFYLEAGLVDSGFTGNHQLANPEILFNDGLNNAYDTSSIEVKTVDEIANNPATNNITATVFKVRGKMSKNVSQFATSYRFEDDNGNGIPMYSQLSGSDLAWLDEYVGVDCWFYIGVQNAKISSGNLNWRSAPVAFVELAK